MAMGRRKAEERELDVQPVLVDEKYAAAYIGMSMSFLRRTRMEGTLKSRTPGPKFLKIGRTVRYEMAELDRWIDQFRGEDSCVPVRMEPLPSRRGAGSSSRSA
jgi:predicted DNA-binding transcriptional regulator AlpA